MLKQARTVAAKKAAGRRTGGAKKSASRKTVAKKGGGRQGAAKKAPARGGRSGAMSMMPNWFNDALSSTIGREALAAALIAGAGAAAAVLAKRSAGGKVKSAMAEASNATRDFADATADAFVEATSGAVRKFLPQSERDEDEDDEFSPSSRR
jgi:hypothetical protein